MRAGLSRFPEKSLKVAKLRKSCLQAGTLYKEYKHSHWETCGTENQEGRIM